MIQMWCQNICQNWIPTGGHGLFATAQNLQQRAITNRACSGNVSALDSTTRLHAPVQTGLAWWWQWPGCPVSATPAIDIPLIYLMGYATIHATCRWNGTEKYWEHWGDWRRKPRWSKIGNRKKLALLAQMVESGMASQIKNLQPNILQFDTDFVKISQPKVRNNFGGIAWPQTWLTNFAHACPSLMGISAPAQWLRVEGGHWPGNRPVNRLVDRLDGRSTDLQFLLCGTV